MTAPGSTHIPHFAGGVESVTDTLTVDTGLRDVQAVSATLAADVLANEEAHVTVSRVAQVEGEPGNAKIILKVWKGGTASGTVGDTAVNVEWMALGK